MAKHSTLKNRRRSDPSLQERADALERASLRRAREHQRRLTMLARSLKRATHAADAWRLAAARALVDGSGWHLVSAEEFTRWQRQHDDAERRLERLATKVRELELEKRGALESI
jgi:hypothetical protein